MAQALDTAIEVLKREINAAMKVQVAVAQANGTYYHVLERIEHLESAIKVLEKARNDEQS